MIKEVKQPIVAQLPVPLAERIEAGIILGSAMKLAREDKTIASVGFYIDEDEHLGLDISFAVGIDDKKNRDISWKRFTEEIDSNLAKASTLVENPEVLFIGSYKEHDMSSDKDYWLGTNIQRWNAKAA